MDSQIILFKESLCHTEKTNQFNKRVNKVAQQNYTFLKQERAKTPVFAQEMSGRLAFSSFSVQICRVSSNARLALVTQPGTFDDGQAESLCRDVLHLAGQAATVIGV